MPLNAHHLLPPDIADRLDDYELELIETYIGIALDTLPDSGTQPWYGSGDQASGEIKVLRSFEFNALHCREIQLSVKKENYTDQRTFNYCQQNLHWQPLSYK